MNKSNWKPLTSLLFLTFYIIYSQRLKAQGIDFLPGTFQNASEVAKRSNKILFVEVYLDGCPHCAALAPVLQEQKVGSFYNTNFVSIKIEANSSDSKVLQQQKNLTYVEFPMFFFFDPITGQAIHQASPGESPTRDAAIEAVIAHGRDAINPDQRTSNYPNRYEKGDRSLSFLIDYARYAKAHKNEKLVAQITNDMASIIVKPEDLESQVCFFIIQRFINDIDNPIAIYFFKNLNKYKAKFPAKEVRDAAEAITYYTLYGYRGNDLEISKIIEIRNAMLTAGIAPDIASSRTILKELDAHFKAKNMTKATARLNEHRKLSKLVIQDYAYLLRLFNEKATDTSYVPSLLEWSKEALKSNKPSEKNSKEVAEIYLEEGKAYLKVAKKAEAKQAFQEGLRIAQAAKLDTKIFKDELAKAK